MSRSFLNVCQEKSPDHNHDHETQQQCIYINFIVNYEVEYLPNHLNMNLKSHKFPPFYLNRALLLDHGTIRDTMSRILSRVTTHVPENDIGHITKIVHSKANSINNDPCNTGYNVIPIVMSLRAVWVQQFNQDAVLAWKRLLPNGVELSFNLPAMDKSVKELDKVIFRDQDTCLDGRCAICLKKFHFGEEVTRMPCLHVYHGDCIVRWFKNSHLCPSCRFPMPVCRVVDVTFPFLKRCHCAQVGGKIGRTNARMSVRFPVY